MVKDRLLFVGGLIGVVGTVYSGIAIRSYEDELVRFEKNVVRITRDYYSSAELTAQTEERKRIENNQLYAVGGVILSVGALGLSAYHLLKPHENEIL